MANFSLTSTISITCPKGITPYLKKELEELGFPIKKTRPAGIETEGSLYDCMKLNLVLRTAHRVHFLMDTFKAENAEDLTDGLKKIAWENFIDKHGYVSITSFIKNPTINNNQFANLTVKDAIVDRIRMTRGARPDSGADLTKTVIFLFWKGEEASVYLDTSGESISRRNYKVDNHTASMQETLAAAVILGSKWKPGQHLINPMCGSGTIAIEAAMMALNRPAGQLRPNYGIKHILGFDEEKWTELRNELKQESLKDFPNHSRILATDNDPKAIEAAKRNAKTAGVDHLIEFQECEFYDTEIPYGDGVVIFNPPYGERLGEDKNLPGLYRAIGDFFKQDCSGKWGYVFTGNFALAKKVGLRSNKRIEFYNSTIECRLLEYELY